MIIAFAPTTIMRIRSLAILPLIQIGRVYAHGDHSNYVAGNNADAAAEIPPASDEALNRVRGPGDYAQRHVRYCYTQITLCDSISYYVHVDGAGASHVGVVGKRTQSCSSRIG